MKSAIFCLLAFCVFETIFASAVDVDYAKGDKFNLNLDKLKDGFNCKMQVAASSAQSKVEDLQKKFEKTPCADICLNKSIETIMKIYTDRFEECTTCYGKALRDKNVKNFKSCCKKALDAVKQEGKANGVVANKVCVTQCE